MSGRGRSENKGPEVGEGAAHSTDSEGSKATTVAGCSQQAGAWVGGRGQVEMKVGQISEGFNSEGEGMPPLQGSQQRSKGVAC